MKFQGVDLVDGWLIDKEDETTKEVPIGWLCHVRAGIAFLM